MLQVGSKEFYLKKTEDMSDTELALCTSVYCSCQTLPDRIASLHLRFLKYGGSKDKQSIETFEGLAIEMLAECDMLEITFDRLKNSYTKRNQKANDLITMLRNEIDNDRNSLTRLQKKIKTELNKLSGTTVE